MRSRIRAAIKKKRFSSGWHLAVEGVKLAILAINAGSYWISGLVLQRKWANENRYYGVAKRVRGAVSYWKVRTRSLPDVSKFVVYRFRNIVVFVPGLQGICYNMQHVQSKSQGARVNYVCCKAGLTVSAPVYHRYTKLKFSTLGQCKVVFYSTFRKWMDI